MVAKLRRAKVDRVLGAAGKAARRLARAGIKLRRVIVTAATEKKYNAGVLLFYIWLAQYGLALPDCYVDLDLILCDFIQHSWEEGEVRGYVGNALSGVSHFLPDVRGHLKSAWRLYGAWQRMELPARAPPMPEAVLFGVAGHCVRKGAYAMGVCLLVFFHCFIRTGELLALTVDQIVVTASEGVISLPNTKSGQRTGALEAVSITSDVVAVWLGFWTKVRRKQAGNFAKLWPGTAAEFRRLFKALMQHFHLEEWEFQPYSLRRGGATAFFRETGSMERTLARGRWGTSRVARIYINDGLATLAGLHLSQGQLDELEKEALQLLK